MIKMVESKTLCSKWWNPGHYAQTGGNQCNTVRLNIDVLPPLVVVFLQFKICMWFPRHMYKDMVLLSTVVFVAIEQ